LIYVSEETMGKNPRFLDRRFYKAGESLGELLISPVHIFISRQVSSGILIMIMTVAALVWANSGWSDWYELLWRTDFTVGARGRTLDKPLHFWVNEGLMTFFFFVVGLEIKREVLIGELASFRKAVMPVTAAVGGMVAPALIYYLMNPSGMAVRGWAIPTATDIAFTIGVLTILGARVPRSLTVFLAALAIVDDLGAVLVIALFYTTEISAFHLQVTAALVFTLVIINVLGYRSPLPYLVVGCFVWLAVYLSGVHSTVAGILVALTIPARSKCDTDSFLKGTQTLLEKFRCTGPCGYSVYTNFRHQDTVSQIEALCLAVMPPLLRIERLLSPWVVFIIVPLFALANAGVHLDWPSFMNAFGSRPTLGVFLGLVLGKQVGIFSFSWIAIRLGIAERPVGASWLQIYGCAILSGIGFTMSIFIADLAFAQSVFLELAKIGILSSSAVSLILGLSVLYIASRQISPDKVSDQ
jgi:Na+:H+ antiporter, NhaA family